MYDYFCADAYADVFEEKAVDLHEVIAETRAVKEQLVSGADRALTQLKLEQRNRRVCRNNNIQK